MNEDNAVIQYKIVPNDKKEYLEELLSNIWSKTKVTTLAMYTDHPAKDSNTIINTWNNFFDEDFDITVLQDIYHAQNRVIKVMNKRHSDFPFAEKEIKEILFNVKTNIYKTELDLKNALNEWQNKWKNIKNFGDKMNDFQLVAFLGIYILTINTFK